MRHLLLCILLLAGILAPPASGATVDGLRLHSSISSMGHGSKTVILVHGWTCDDRSWAEQVPVLAKTYRVVTLDLPGQGRSASPRDGKFSMDLFARAVEAVRLESKADKVVLVGHSIGAMLATFDASNWKDDVMTMPVLGIYAEKSQLANPAYSKTIFPAFEYVEVPGTGHFVMMEKPQEFNQLLTTFLNKIDY
jgi:pimeloyl-ACP methyl ester carboxylesterase